MVETLNEMKREENRIFIQETQRLGWINGGVGILLNIVMCVFVFVGFEQKIFLAIVPAMFLGLVISSFKTLKSFYRIKTDNPFCFERLRGAFAINLVNLVLMSIGLTTCSIWVRLMIA